jgi:hypothetical protein
LNAKWNKEAFMKKNYIFLRIIPVVFILSVLMADTGFSEVNVNIGVNIPLPGFVFPGPPAVVLIPGTYVYAVPDVDVDIVFFQGYWYRPHRDYWYRSASYNGPWGVIAHKRVPAAIIGLPPGYRHVPPGHQRIPYGHLKKNWKTWERQRYWDAHEYRHEQWERHQEHGPGHHKKDIHEYDHKGGDGHHHKGGKNK